MGKRVHGPFGVGQAFVLFLSGWGALWRRCSTGCLGASVAARQLGIQPLHDGGGVGRGRRPTRRRTGKRRSCSVCG